MGLQRDHRISPDNDQANLEVIISEPLWLNWSDAVRSQVDAEDSVAQAKPADNQWREGLSQTLEFVPVSAEAVLCQQEIDLSDVVRWRPGEVVR